MPLVTIFGGSGFVGRYIARKMAKAGWRVRVAVRKPHLAHFVRPYGEVGQVEPVQANIRDEVSTRRAVQGADVVINCVGLMYVSGKQQFDSVQAEGAARLARLSREAGVKRFVHLSAIGADPASDSDYARTKGEAEAAVLAAYPDAAILRPSVIFGHEDQFFNRFAAMARLSPLLPVVGATTRLQPVYVDDVAEAAARCALGQVAGGIYELGGPRVITMRAAMAEMLAIIHRRRLLLSVPGFVARLKAKAFGLLPYLTLGLVPNTFLTEDQVRLLARDNVVSPGARGFADLGIVPTDMAAVLPRYLFAYRPNGQYDDVIVSAG